MALQMHSHFHLDTVTPPVVEYTASLAGYKPQLPVVTVVEEALNGARHMHVLKDAGTPVEREDYVLRLRVSRAELETIKGLRGSVLYYVDNYHDDAAIAGYVLPVALTGINFDRGLEPQLDHIQITIRLEDIE